MGMLREAALMQKVWLVCRVARQTMTNEPGGIMICLPFCGSRARRVQDVSGWSLDFASGLLGSCGARSGGLQDPGSWVVMNSCPEPGS